LRDKNDPKSRFTQYYYITANPGTGIIAKNRLGVEGGKSYLPTEIIFDPVKGEGTFSWLLEKAQEAYREFLVKQGVK